MFFVFLCFVFLPYVLVLCVVRFFVVAEWPDGE